jgi:uncharacterized membrane protein
VLFMQGCFMAGNGSTEVIARQTWIDGPAELIQRGTRTAFDKTGPRGAWVRDVLHGTWLGHPLHAAVTDVPIGAWTTAVCLDALESATGREELGPGADAAVGIGLIGAVAAAVTGLTDYQHPDVTGDARRVGLVHALLNIATTSCFAASYMARKRGSRGTGKWWGVAGITIGMIAAKLGGDLAYTYGIGVDRGATAGQRVDNVA